VLLPEQRQSTYMSRAESPETLVLLHGAWHTGASYRPLQDNLSTRGYASIAPTLPTDTIEKNLDDVTEEALAAIGDLENIVFLAHSRGAHEVLPEVVQHIEPSRITGAIIFNSGGPRDFTLPSGNTYSETPRYTPEFSSLVVEDTAASLTYLDPEKFDEIRERLYNDVSSDAVVRQAIRSLRKHRMTDRTRATPPFPQNVPLRSIVSVDDRVLHVPREREVMKFWLGVTKPTEIPGGHTPQLSRPAHLADVIIQAAHSMRAETADLIHNRKPS
jgi:pimeloyl-ACP methyl ester carboxylesterase